MISPTHIPTISSPHPTTRPLRFAHTPKIDPQNVQTPPKTQPADPPKPSFLNRLGKNIFTRLKNGVTDTINLFTNSQNWNRLMFMTTTVAMGLTFVKALVIGPLAILAFPINVGAGLMWSAIEAFARGFAESPENPTPTQPEQPEPQKPA